MSGPNITPVAADATHIQIMCDECLRASSSRASPPPGHVDVEFLAHLPLHLASVQVECPQGHKHTLARPGGMSAEQLDF
jgi:hypothetical protein